MAESTAIGLTSALVHFVDYGSRVVRHLRRMEIAHEDMPVVFQGIRTRLPLMLDLVRKIMLQMDAGLVVENTQEAMFPVVRDCARHAKDLCDLVNNTMSPQSSSNPALAYQKSLSLDKVAETEVSSIDSALKANFDFLARAGTFHQGNRPGNSRSTFRLVGSTPAPIAIPPFERHPSSPLHTSSSHPGLERRATTFHPSPERRSISLHPSPNHDRRVVNQVYEQMYERRVVTPILAVFMVPFPRDINFVGRNDILKDIDERFSEQSCVALTGLGGIGKSQIAIEYAYIYRDRHPTCPVLWVYGSTPARIEESYAEIARRLQIPGWDDPDHNTMQLVFDWLNNTADESRDDGGKWLLILDNADDAATFYSSKSGSIPDNIDRPTKTYARYLPTNAAGQVLITTRDRRVGERLSGRQRPLEISLMSEHEARELLKSKVAEDNWSDVDGLKLVEELSFLPLAITQAAAFISENNLSVSEYLEMLFAGDEDIKELLSEHLEDSRREIDAENSVMRTWKLSFDQLSTGMPRAAEILSLMAVLDFHDVHQSLLRREKETETLFRIGLGALQAFQLITVGRGKDGVCKMHRLVALSTQKWLEVRGDASHWRTEALNVLEKRFPGPGHQNFQDWATYEALTPHARLIFSFSYSQADDQLKKAKLLVAVTLYHLSKGRYDEAFNMSSKALEIRQALLPQDDPLTLDSVQTIGEALLHRGELKMARTMLERAVVGRQKSLGPDEPDTLESLSDLTITLIELGDQDRAEVTGSKALRGREKVLGPTHPDTVGSENILAILRHRQGRLDEAKTLGENVLTRREAMLGHEHPHTIMTANNMGRLYYDLGDMERAQLLFERAIAGEDEVLGSEGYDIQVTLSNLALVKCAQKDYDAAEKLLRQVLGMRERLLGIEHPSAVFTVRMLAEVMRQRGHKADADAMDRLARSRTKPRVEELGELLRAGLLFD